jgi:photosystem II stability/assembly factor-like uncharacterized protein
MRLFPLLLCLSLSALAQDEPPAAGGGDRGGPASNEPINESTFSSLKARQIGPAFVSGRISQIAMFPDDSSHYLIALASGNIFATTNNGTTWTPVFDNYGSYSIGGITIDPKNPSIVWVGTGENNNQRSVSYGDGVYKSEDGGRTFRNVGSNSPNTSPASWWTRAIPTWSTCCLGPLWKGGGERGLYKTTDGGKTWSASLIKVGDYTGCSDVIMDPRNPDILLAATHQRQRRYFGMIHGGPESALYRSIDAGKTWTPVRGGFPTGDLGRIGLNQAPSNPSIIYAQVEGPEGRGGTYRSTDNGVTWEARQLRPAGPVLFQGAGGPGQLRPHLHHEHEHHGERRWRPHGPRSARATSTWTITISGRPQKQQHYLVGCDGGLYESFDRAATWNFKETCPPPRCTTSTSARRALHTSTAAPG